MVKHLLCLVLILKEIIQIGNSTSSDLDSIDKNLLKSLASYYGNVVSGNTLEFESSLVEYFKLHYKDIIEDKNGDFLYKFSDKGNETIEEGDLFKIARSFDIDVNLFENHFGHNLFIKDGLIYEENNELNVIYATDKAINGIVEDLQSSALYYNHLANENYIKSSNISSLKNKFIEFASHNNIELQSASKIQSANYNRRFVKRKNHKNDQDNVIDFRKQSC